MSLSHRQLATELDVPISAVAIAREVVRGTSAGATQALAEAEGDLVRAAVALARRRRCPDEVVEAITPTLTQGVRMRTPKRDRR